MNTKNAGAVLLQQSQAFLPYIEEWMANLQELAASDVFSNPQRSAVLSVDLIQGFCNSGALASPRVGAIVAPAVRLFQSAWDQGVRSFVLSQDTHEPDAVEFSAWPAHCVRGTPEAQAVAEIRSLPFYDQMLTFEKNSISSTTSAGLAGWLAGHPAVDTFVVVGDCTDLCVYQLAMDLRLKANERQLARRVIVPAECVDTYDLPVEAARAAGILPHPADLIHALFLYHLALNGVEVVKNIR